MVVPRAGARIDDDYFLSQTKQTVRKELSKSDREALAEKCVAGAKLLVKDTLQTDIPPKSQSVVVLCG